MAEQTAAQVKLTQYLTEAYGKEKELESTLPLHIELNNRAPYKKRLQQHLRETKNHAKLLERRIKQISGSGVGTVSLATGQQLLGRALPAVKGPLQTLRGTGVEEKLLKNAKTEYWNEHEEIATYSAIETLAETVGDKETAQVAKQIRREEERMASFLEKQIPLLTRAVAQAEIPASERKGGSSRRRARRKPARSGSARSSAKRGASSRSGASKRSASAKRASSSRSSARSTKRGASTSRKSASSRGASAKRTGTRSASAKRTGTRSASAKRGGSSRSKASSRSSSSRSSSSRSPRSRGSSR